MNGITFFATCHAARVTECREHQHAQLPVAIGLKRVQQMRERRGRVGVDVHPLWLRCVASGGGARAATISRNVRPRRAAAGAGMGAGAGAGMCAAAGAVMWVAAGAGTGAGAGMLASLYSAIVRHL